MEQWIRKLSDCLPALKEICPHEFLLRFTLEDFNCLRFANSRGTQNTSVQSIFLNLVVVKEEDGGGRMVSCSSNSFEPEVLMKQALAAIPETPVNNEFKGFCPPGLQYPVVQTYYASTANLTAPEKARRLESLRRKNKDLWLGGIWENSTTLRALAGSNGLFLQEMATKYIFEAKALLDDRAASVYRIGRNVDDLDECAELQRAIAPLRKKPPHRQIPDGVYRCLFGPEAVSEMCFFISLHGFGGRGFKQGQNFTCKHIGKNLFENERIVLKDRGTNEQTLTKAYDSWGFPRQELTLIDGGKVCQMAHDQFTAELIDGNTGHGDGSPAAMLMELAPGKSLLAELLAADEQLLQISRFHYPTVADPSKPLLKGSTKDGTYLIDGEDIYEVGGLEFYFNPIELLGSTVELSRERFVIPQGSLAMSRPGANIVPWILVADVEVRQGTLHKE